MRIQTQPPAPPARRPSRPDPPKDPSDPGDVPVARDIPFLPVASAGVGALAGGILGRSAFGVAVGAAVGGAAGVVLDNIARWVTPEGPRLIVGHTTEDEARVWGRGDAKHPVMFVDVRNAQDQSVYSGHLALTAETGFTGTADATGLQPGQSYRCQVAYGASEDTPAEERRYSAEGSFRTSTPNDKETTFLLGSCNHHRFWRRNEAWERLDQVDRQVNPDFMLHLGDQIYADQPLQTYQLDGFRGCYRRAWSSPETRDVLSRHANYMILDDHEIGNGFSQKGHMGKFRRGWLLLKGLWGSDASQRKSLEKAGIRAYLDYQDSHNPHVFEADKLYYTFSRGENQFFVMDARNERNPDQGHLISPLQMQRVKDWLSSHPDQPKFLVSPVPFLAEEKERGADEIWTSTAYRAQRDEILDYIASHQLKGVCVLSGDSHTSYHAETELHPAGQAPIEVHELSASPINGFWVHGAHMWEDEHADHTPGGIEYQTHFDTKNFCAAERDFSRDASGFMSIRTDGDVVEYQIHRTHRDDGGPFRSDSFKLGLKS